MNPLLQLARECDAKVTLLCGRGDPISVEFIVKHDGMEDQLADYVGRIRAAALEEAAKLAERHYIPGHTVAGPHFAARCAAAIRALALPSIPGEPRP